MNADGYQQFSKDDGNIDFEGLYQSFAAANDLHQVSQQILDLATHMTGAEKCSLMLLNGRGELYVLNARGMDQNAVGSFRSKVGEGIAGRVAAEGAPLIVEDISADQRFTVSRGDKYRTGSFIACPITTREKVIGVLNMNDKSTGAPFSPADLDQAKMIALLAAIALRSFLSDSRPHMKSVEVDELYRRLVDAERHNREFIARLSHEMRTPLNNIKGAVYYLQSPSRTASGNDQDFYQIIEREVNYLISYFDEGMKKLEMEHVRLFSKDHLDKYLRWDK